MTLKYLCRVLLLAALGSCNTSSNQDMVELLAERRQINLSEKNPFSAEGKLVALENKAIDPGDLARQYLNNFVKANLLVKTGNEMEAFQILEKLLNGVDSSNPATFRTVLRAYGIAALRLGERQNCFNSHSPESCIMPVKGMGVHHRTAGSENAIRAYETLLEMTPDDLESRWLLNIAYMTVGKYPDQVPEKWLIPGLDSYDPQYAIKPFRDIAPQLKLDIKNTAGGVVVEDFNKDGFLDIVTSDWDLGGAMHFFKNDGTGGFTDISASSNIGLFKGGLNMIQADYNNDGFTDILVLRGAWMPDEFGKQPNSLLRNNGDETFTDVTVESGLLSFHPTQTAVWRDFNNDGWLDLFIGNESSKAEDKHTCELFISDQKGKFKEMSVQANCAITSFVKGVASADYNNDGLMDLFLSVGDGNSVLLKNTGSRDKIPHFENVTKQAGIKPLYVRTFPTWFWDYDNDGWPDIFVCGYQSARSIAHSVATEALGKENGNNCSKMYLYHNNQDGTFTEVSNAAGLQHAVFSMGSNFGDIDNDGYLDMYLGTGDPDFSALSPNKLYRNLDGKRFVDVTVSGKVGNLQKGHGVAFSDIDNDGDQDIFLETGGAFAGDNYYNSLYLNPGQNTNNWIYLKLVGRESNRSAIGSRIVIKFKENGLQRTIFRDVNSGGSFGASPLRREIGIGKAARIDEITITWPGSRKTQTFTNFLPGQFLEITEGKTDIKKLVLNKLDYEGSDRIFLDCAPITKAY